MQVKTQQDRIRAQLAISFCYFRGTDFVCSLPIANRRLSVYRHVMMQAGDNKIGCERKLRLAKSMQSKYRWEDAIVFWDAVAAACHEKIKKMGESF